MAKAKSGLTGPRFVYSAPEGWNYRGVSEQLDKIEKRLKTTQSLNAIQNAALALREQDRVITKALSADTEGDKRSLMSLRRRTRMLISEAKKLF